MSWKNYAILTSSRLNTTYSLGESSLSSICTPESAQYPTARTVYEKTALQRQIEAADREIDGLVYDLYGLATSPPSLARSPLSGGLPLLPQPPNPKPQIPSPPEGVPPPKGTLRVGTSPKPKSPNCPEPQASLPRKGVPSGRERDPNGINHVCKLDTRGPGAHGGGGEQAVSYPLTIFILSLIGGAP